MAFAAADSVWHATWQVHRLLGGQLVARLLGIVQRLKVNGSCLGCLKLLGGQFGLACFRGDS